MTFVPVVKQLVPLDVSDLINTDGEEELTYPPLFDPDPETVADLVLPHYIDALLYSSLIESELSEQSSRRNAMETATDSADKLNAQLKIKYNKARQGAITQEITEVVSGANTGKDDD
jgi:F-type H+-transporting ATPase subunit gamma